MQKLWRHLSWFSFFLLPAYSHNLPSASENLVASWSFDESSDSVCIDSSDRGNTAFIHSGTRATGIKGGALSFNGTTDYAYAKNSASLTIDKAITIECWANVRQINPVSGSGQTFIRKEKAYALGIGAGGKIGFQICVDGNWTGGWTLSQQSIQPSQWYHIAAVWTGKTMKMYVNGVQDPIIYPANGTVRNATYLVYLGTFYESNYEKLNGMLDEIRIYSDTLSPEVILAHFTGKKPQTPVLIPCLPNPTYDRRPTFSWYRLKDAFVYRFQIASTQQFSSQIVSIPTEDTVYTPTVDLPLGMVYWRVGSEPDASLWSSVFSVYIQDTTVPMLIPYTPKSSRERKPVLRWWSVKNANTYSIQLFSLPNSITPYIADAVPDTFYSPSIDLPSGNFSWRVKSDLNAMYSLPDTFQILNDSVPILNPMVPDTQSDRTPLFTWCSAEGAAHYIIQIDTMGTFAPPFISTPVADTFYLPQVNLPFGRIVWHVSSSTNPARYSPADTFWISKNSRIGSSDARGKTPNKVDFSVTHEGIEVSYSIDRPSNISITIFNMSGAKVWSYNQRAVIPGSYRIGWRDGDRTVSLPPRGCYLARFKAENRSNMVKLILLR